MSLDLFHYYGEDLSLSPSGGLAVAANEATLALQTVARFILTNPGDDPWNPTWGLGAKKLIGQNAAPVRVRALILQGMATLGVVDQSSPVSVSVVSDPDGTLTAAIGYIDASSGSQVGVTIPIG